MTNTPKVSFYPLQQPGNDGLLLFVCRLVEKARQRNHRVHLLCKSEQQGQMLDKMLWQFRPDAFIPHQLVKDEQEVTQPGIAVTLGTTNYLPDHPDMLINLSNEVWQLHDRFKDIREIVAASDEDRDKGRERYRQYQSLGYTLQTLRP